MTRGELYCENVDFGVVYKGLADWVDLGLMFKREYEKDGRGGLDVRRTGRT